jgi:VWFA-related protein
MLKRVLRFLLVLAVLPLHAQQGADNPPIQAPIQANVPLVLAPVTVTDRKGNLIDGLTVKDFILTDEGVPQKLRLDTSDTVLAPVSLVVLVQSSGISTPELFRIQRVGSMIKPLVIGDRGQAAVIAFDDETRVFEDFTSDSSKISSAFERINPRTIRSAKLIDAVGAGVRMLATRPANNRRIMLLLSESRDRGSRMKLAEAIEQAQRAGVVIYAGTYSAQGAAWTSKAENAPPMPGGPDYLGGIGELVRLGKANAADEFARATGGRHLSFLTLNSLEKTISRTGEEIHSQYLLSFVPADSRKSGFHRIQVAVPSRPDAVIRVRAGYWTEQ